VREPNERCLLIRQQTEAQGIGQQRSRESSLIPCGHQPPKVTAEGPDSPGELLTLGSSLVMVQMPDPAPARRVTDEELPGFVKDLREPVAQGRQARLATALPQPVQQPLLIMEKPAGPLPRGRSCYHGQHPVTAVRSLLDRQQLPLDELDQRDRDIPHDDPAEDDDPRLPGPESLRCRWKIVHSPSPSGVVEEAIR
jgi:hypothetical protein